MALATPIAVVTPVARSGGSPPGSLPGQIVFTCQQPEPSDSSICAMNPDGSDVHTVEPCGNPDMEAGCSHPALSPDGTRLAYEGGEGTLAITSADGKTDNSPTNQNPGFGSSPAWSPRGDLLAFISCEPSPCSIETVKADGTDLRTVIKDPRISPDGGVAWSPDSGGLAYATRPKGTPIPSGDIDVVSTSAGATFAPHPLVTDVLGGAGELSWAPSGTLLFTNGHEPGIWQADASGWAENPAPFESRPVESLLCGTCADLSPSWGPDGAHFSVIRDGRVAIATIDQGVQGTIGPRGVLFAQWAGASSPSSEPDIANQPTEPCVVVESTGEEHFDLSAGFGRIFSGGVSAGTGLTVTGQRLADDSGTAALIVNSESGPFVALGLDHEVGGPRAAEAEEVSAPVAQPSGESGGLSFANLGELKLGFEQDAGNAREWEFPSLSATQDFINTAGKWYSEHSWVFLPGVSNWINPYDQFPPPDETWLSRSNSLKASEGVSAGLAAKFGEEVPLSTMTLLHLRWGGNPAARTVTSVLSDFQIPKASAPNDMLLPFGSQSGTLELSTPTSEGSRGLPDEAILSYDSAGDATELTLDVGFGGGLRGGLLGRLGANGIDYENSFGTFTSSEDINRYVMSLPLDSARNQQALARFWAAVELPGHEGLEDAAQELFELIKSDGEITESDYTVDAGTDTNPTVTIPYRLLSASIESGASQKLAVLKNAVYWDRQANRFAQWTNCTQSPAAEPLHIPSS
jgi:Tol biopolymer transport system component